MHFSYFCKALHLGCLLKLWIRFCFTYSTGKKMFKVNKKSTLRQSLKLIQSSQHLLYHGILGAFRMLLLLTLRNFHAFIHCLGFSLKETFVFVDCVASCFRRNYTVPILNNYRRNYKNSSFEGVN